MFSALYFLQHTRTVKVSCPAWQPLFIDFPRSTTSSNTAKQWRDDSQRHFGGEGLDTRPSSGYPSTLGGSTEPLHATWSAPTLGSGGSNLARFAPRSPRAYQRERIKAWTSSWTWTWRLLHLLLALHTAPVRCRCRRSRVAAARLQIFVCRDTELQTSTVQ